MFREVKSVVVPLITMTFVLSAAFLVRLGLALEYVR